MVGPQTLTKIGAQLEVQVIIFVGGTMRSVIVRSFESNLKALEVKQKQWNSIRTLHARALLEAHDEVLRAY
jgi:hypothetical protein